MPDRGFISLYISMIYAPGATFRALESDPRRMRYGVYALLVPALAYTLFYILASQAGGAPSSFQPWLNIPLERYFTYAIFLSVPGYVLAFFFACGFMYAIASLLSLRMSFESVAAIIGFGVGIGSLSGMLHDLTDAVLGFAGLLDMAWYEQQLNEPTIWMLLLWTVYTIYFVWFFVLFFKGARVMANAPRAKAAVFATAAVLSFQSVLLIFIR